MAGDALQKVFQTASVRGGAQAYRNITLVNTGVVVKATPGQIYSINVHNLNAAIRYLKFYNKATTPTSSDTPVFTVPMPPGSAPPFQFPVGCEFSAGISIRATTGLADNDNTAPTAGETILNLTYE